MKKRLGYFFSDSYLLLIIIGILIFIFTFFSLNHGDLVVTSMIADGVIKGHFLDLYDYIIQYVSVDQVAYFPTTYFLFALWNLPLYLIKGNVYYLREGIMDWNHYGLGIYWTKLLPVLFFCLTAIVFYNILKLLKIDKEKRKIGLLFWLTFPLSFFSQFIFGQYDIFYVFFMFLGIKYFLQERPVKGSFLFGIAFTFKYFPILIFIPIIVYKYKNNIVKLFQYFFLSFVPLFIELVLFINSHGFVSTILSGGAGLTGYSNRLFSAGFSNGFASGSYLLVGYLLVMFYLFFIQDSFSEKILLKWIVICASLFALFIPWNPQWILFSSSFLPFLPFISELDENRLKKYLILDALLMLFFVALVSVTFQWNVDINMFNTTPFLRGINPAVQGESINLGFIYSLGQARGTDSFKSLYYSGFFTAWIGYLLFFLWNEKKNCNIEGAFDLILSEKMIWLRFSLSSLFFLLPALIALFFGQSLVK